MKKNMSIEKISTRILYALIAVIAVVFIAFWVIGYNTPWEENPDFNAPLLTDVVLVLTYVMLLLAIASAIYGATRYYRRKK